ncbi:MAG: SDR family NAD(P)-dependent oxidoreductase [Alphaproteobacteria bacterium]|nr:MAG: SDR family NAD(P)-dependent oxidoreductase [Alphaproteobacteria bacterium]
MQTQQIALVTGANQGIGAGAQAIQLDVTDSASIAAAAERIRSEFGRLDLLINNAAISHAGQPGRTLAEGIASSRASVASLDEVRAVFETNVFGVIAVTQALLPLLKEAPAARIVNVGSGVGSLTLNSDPTFPYRDGFGVVYAASKTALNAVTLSFAIELEATGIKVNVASPGFTATALNNFEGTDTVEQGAKNPVRVALDVDGPTGTFTGPSGPMPW